MDLKNDKRQHTARTGLLFTRSLWNGKEETESRLAAHATESPANTDRLMEEAWIARQVLFQVVRELPEEECESLALLRCWIDLSGKAVLQVLQRRWDRTFSQHSYGLRQDGQLIRQWGRSQNGSRTSGR